MEKVEQLRELLAKATPGPWQSKDPYLWDEIVGNIDGPDDGQYHYTEVAQAFGRADAALIVAAVSALPGLLDTIAALEARVRELEARERDLQRALSRWLPQIAGDDERGPMYAAASEDSMLLMGLCDETAESEWYGQHILQRAEAAEALASQIRTDWLPANERLAARAEQAEAALSVVRQLPEKWRERKPGAGRMSDLSNVVRKTCADELSAAIAHGGAGEGEKNG